MWNECVGAGRANEALRADWQAHFREAVQVLGARHVRFHGLFHDDMFVYRTDNGGGFGPNQPLPEPVYTFAYVDKVFDAILDAGARPFVELGFMPRELATQTETLFWWKAHCSPPKEMGRWVALVDATVRHWIERYGIDEVRQWPFEVWNEPNLVPNFWTGTRTEYFELYEATARAIKAIDPRLRVGGPSTSVFVPDARYSGETYDPSLEVETAVATDPDELDWQPVWIHELIEYCAQRGLPIDFLSTHLYPTDYAADSAGQPQRDHAPEGRHVRRPAASCARSSRTARTRMPSCTSPSGRPRRRAATRSTTRSSPPRTSSGRSSRARRWPTRSPTGPSPTCSRRAAAASAPSTAASASLTRTACTSRRSTRWPCSTASVTASWPSCPTAPSPARPRRVTCRPSSTTTPPIWARRGSRPATATPRREPSPRWAPSAASGTASRDCARAPSFTVEILDWEHGNVAEAWYQMGAPLNITREQTAELRHVADGLHRSTLTAGDDGVLDIDLTLPAWAVASVAPTLARAAACRIPGALRPRGGSIRH